MLEVFIKIKVAAIMELQGLVQSLKGIGEQTASKLNKIDIYTIDDLITHYPREYQDRRVITNIKDITLDEDNNILATIASVPKIMKRSNKIIVTFLIKDATGAIFVTFYNQPYMKNNFSLGERYIFYGKIKRKNSKIEMESPEYEKIEAGKDLNAKASIIPIYPATKKLSQKILRGLIDTALRESLVNIKENLPDKIRETYQLIDKKTALINIHFPKDNHLFFEARKRLVFEELFMLLLTLSSLKEDFMGKTEGVAYHIPSDLKDFIDKLPFALTNAQKRVLKEIIHDMKSPYAMNRLLQGDVGSGKTVVAAVMLFICVRNGMQGALMAPTEVLATQHYAFLSELFMPFNIKVGLLTGSTTKKQKDELIKSISDQTIHILVGTHALIEDPVNFNSLGLVITDEQHRFGVRQRVRLLDKGQTPDVMVMSATPIPRTLAMILYGDMDVSVIDELPPGRQPIKTNVVDTSYYDRIYAFIKGQINEGRQCYIICPLVEETKDQSNLKDVISYTQRLQTEIFCDKTVAFLHGKMKPKDKNQIMDKFGKGEIDILVSTTVIEVGINVPNATVMMVENADRFGLAQLHQLRGRVGRGQHKSYCILISNSKNKLTKKRLKIMEQTTDGFLIAEMDLKLRGPGDFFGTKQHGLPEMKIANLYKDTEVLKEVQEAVKEVISKDRYLDNPEYKLLKDQVLDIISKNDVHHTL